MDSLSIGLPVFCVLRIPCTGPNIHTTTKFSRCWWKDLFDQTNGVIWKPQTTTTMTDAANIEDYDFSTGDAGASHIYNMEAGQIRVGG